MPIDITITGLTQQQQQELGEAFDKKFEGRLEAGLSKAQWVKLHVFRYIKGVVKSVRQQTYREQIETSNADVETSYGDTVA